MDFGRKARNYRCRRRTITCAGPRFGHAGEKIVARLATHQPVANLDQPVRIRTARNYFNAQQFAADPSVEKPTNNKYEFGGVFGGPIVQDKMHFFVSLERRLNNPARARIFSTRPELTWSSPESWRALNTMYRVDHQVNGNNSWALRYMRETSPEDNRIGNRTELSSVDSTDDEYMFVGSYTSVIGNNVVNTVRVTRTHEFYSGGPPAWYEMGGHTSLSSDIQN